MDLFLEEGDSEEGIDRWVQTASILHSNGDALDIAVRDGRIVRVRGRGVDRVNKGRVSPKDHLRLGGERDHAYREPRPAADAAGTSDADGRRRATCRRGLDHQLGARGADAGLAGQGLSGPASAEKE